MRDRGAFGWAVRTGRGGDGQAEARPSPPWPVAHRPGGGPERGRSPDGERPGESRRAHRPRRSVDPGSGEPRIRASDCRERRRSHGARPRRGCKAVPRRARALRSGAARRGTRGSSRCSRCSDVPKRATSSTSWQSSRDTGSIGSATSPRKRTRGFTPAMFAQMLGEFRRLRRQEFELDEARYEQLGHEVERWRAHALELARRRELHPKRDLDLGPEL